MLHCMYTISHEHLGMKSTNWRTRWALWPIKTMWLEYCFIHTNSHEHGMAYPRTHELTNSRTHWHESYLARAFFHTHTFSRTLNCVPTNSRTHELTNSQTHKLTKSRTRTHGLTNLLGFLAHKSYMARALPHAHQLTRTWKCVPMNSQTHELAQLFGSRKLYGSSITSCTRTIFKEGGMRAFFVSYPTTVTMNIPGNAVCCSVLQCLGSVLAGCGRVWQGVAVYCSVLQCVAVRCSVLQCVAVCCSVLQGVAVCCSVLQCVAACCSVLQCVVTCCSVLQQVRSLLQCVAVYCSVLQCIAVYCSVWRYVAVWGSVLQCVAVCGNVLQSIAVCGHSKCSTPPQSLRHSRWSSTCSVLQCVAVHCSAIHFTDLVPAVRCRENAGLFQWKYISQYKIQNIPPILNIEYKIYPIC